MDDVTWGVLTLSLTVVCGIGTWLAYQRRGLAAGLKGAGITLLPLAAYLTETLQMFTRIVGAVADWGTSLAFSPVVWLGLVLAGVGVVLYGAGRALASRAAGDEGNAKGKGKAKAKAKEPRQLPPTTPQARSEPVVDDELADIEAILRRRGIT
ncbi:MAG: hypothetical protein WKF79_07440 [Nocardioides sp.]